MADIKNTKDTNLRTKPNEKISSKGNSKIEEKRSTGNIGSTNRTSSKAKSTRIAHSQKTTDYATNLSKEKDGDYKFNRTSAGEKTRLDNKTSLSDAPRKLSAADKTKRLSTADTKQRLKKKQVQSKLKFTEEEKRNSVSKYDISTETANTSTKSPASRNSTMSAKTKADKYNADNLRKPVSTTNVSSLTDTVAATKPNQQKKMLVLNKRRLKNSRNTSFSVEKDAPVISSLNTTGKTHLQQQQKKRLVDESHLKQDKRNTLVQSAKSLKPINENIIISNGKKQPVKKYNITTTAAVSAKAKPVKVTKAKPTITYRPSSDLKHIVKGRSKAFKTIRVVDTKINNKVNQMESLADSMDTGEEGYLDNAAKNIILAPQKAAHNTLNTYDTIRSVVVHHEKKKDKRHDKKNIKLLQKEYVQNNKLKFSDTPNRTAASTVANKNDITSKSKRLQKKNIKREYMRIKNGRKPTTKVGMKMMQQMAIAAKETAKKAIIAIKAPVLAFAALFLVLFVMVYSLFTTIGESGGIGAAAVIETTYPVSDDVLIQCEDWYLDKEQKLREELADYANKHGYDEAIIENGTHEIWHDPYSLAAILCATKRGNEFSFGAAIPIMQFYFDWQYEIVEDWVETKKVFDHYYIQEIPATDEFGHTYLETVQTPIYKDYTICHGHFNFNDLSHLAYPSFSPTQQNYYAIYMAYLGNSHVFDGRPYASKYPDPQIHEIPQEYLDNDETFRVMMEEATKYIGYPYVWGGNRPDSSFDCSGFVSWVLTNSGIENTGRLGAGSLYYKACDPIKDKHGKVIPESDKIEQMKNAKPGDLIFYKGTLEGYTGISHVGIYVGDGWTLAAGNPIEFNHMFYFDKHGNIEKYDEHIFCFGHVRSSLRHNTTEDEEATQMTEYWNNIGITENEADERINHFNTEAGEE